MSDSTFPESPLPETDKARSFTAVLGLLVALITFAYFAWSNDRVLGDADLWWHVKTGQDILLNRAVPWVDTYSYSYAGQPWIAKEWLSQVFLAVAYNIWGWNGVLLESLLVAVLAFVLLYNHLAQNLRPVAAAVVVIVVAIALTPVVIARPHIFTFALVVVMTSKLFGAAEKETPPPWWLLVLIVLWVNLHGSFTFAFVIAGFAFLDAMEKNRLHDRGLVMRWIIFLALCPLVTLINPYGIQPFVIGLNLMSGIQAMTLITEWQPFNAQVDPIDEIGMLLVLGTLLCTRPKLGIFRIFFVLFTLHMMLTHIRFIYIFFLSIPIIVSWAVAKANPSLSWETWAAMPRDALETAAGNNRNMILVIGTVLALVAFAAASIVHPFRPPPRRTIDGAFAYIKEHNLTGPVFNSYNMGGPLILNGFKTYIDGRADQMFQGQFLQDYVNTADAADTTTLQKILEENQMTWTIFPATDPRNQALAKLPGWKQTYTDTYSTIFERQ
jgi:hypothetical protein